MLFCFYPLFWPLFHSVIPLPTVVMLDNSSSSISLPPFPSCATVCYFLFNCLNYTTVALVVTIFTITSIFLLLPLLILVLYGGLQQQRQQRSNRTSRHTDCFTYHMVAIELLGILGSVALLCGIFTDNRPMKITGIYLFTFHLPGQTLFHLLTCLERYVAVIHPITFRRLKEAKAIRIRNVVIGCIWLLCLSEIGFLAAHGVIHIILLASGTCLNIGVASFCSFSVLHALTGPGPKERYREQADQLRLRAFYTMMAILGALLLRFGGHVLSFMVFFLQQVGTTEQCVVVISGVWFGFPSSLILPLLFVHRAGKLYCCRNGNQPEEGTV